MTRKKATVSSSGPMAESTMASGTTANNTVSVPTSHLRAKSREASGKKARELDGSLMNNEDFISKYTYHLFLIIILFYFCKLYGFDETIKTLLSH